MNLRKIIRHLTRDRNRDPPQPQHILTVEQIGPKREMTPEGFMLCRDVPIARAGLMIYGPDETPIRVGPDGIAYVTRTAADLFRPETIASFVGKAIVDEHPEDEVTPNNWAQLTRGVALNIRPGSGEDADVLLADLLIMDARMIRDIDLMKREVSAGYEADYEQTSVGRGTQTGIIGNHIALVEKGRCGPRCAIGDQAFSTATAKEEDMPQATRGRTPAAKPAERRMISSKVLDALMEELGGPDASTMDDGELEGPADSHTHIHIHGIGATGGPGNTGTGGNGEVDVKDDAGEGGAADPNEARFVSLENGHKEILAQIAALTAALSGKGGSGGSDPTGDDGNPFAAKKDDEKKEEKKTDDAGKEEEDDDKGKTKDSAALETSYQETLAGCEILVPGFSMPTFDSKSKRVVTIDRMCQARRKALDAFSASGEGAAIMHSVSGVKTLDMAGMECPAVATLFRATVGAKSLLNNSAATQDAGRMGQQRQEAKKGPSSLADLNKMNREYYAGKH